MVHKKTRQQHGFTLMELLIVMAILGMLAGIVLPQLIGTGERQKPKAAQAGIAILEGALDRYRLDVGKYPKSFEGLVTNGDNHKLWGGPYLKKKKSPEDPWGNPYQYHLPGRHGNDYDLYSFGADNAEGGEGLNADIVNW
ncbi:MAG: type II secretion system major pseudopilin GspG [Gammaproteobacteria bacterium]|nr:type II secretion system major pseudopilin GspG [Gammaproteobacteria bacterium]